DGASGAPGGVVANDQGTRVRQAEPHVDARSNAVFLQASGSAAHGTPELGIGEDAPHTASLVVQLSYRHPVSVARQVLLQEPPGRYVRIIERVRHVGWPHVVPGTESARWHIRPPA